MWQTAEISFFGTIPARYFHHHCAVSWGYWTAVVQRCPHGPGNLHLSPHEGGSINGGIENGWFIVEKLMKVDDLGVPPFIETSMSLPNVLCWERAWQTMWFQARPHGRKRPRGPGRQASSIRSRTKVDPASATAKVFWHFDPIEMGTWTLYIPQNTLWYCHKKGLQINRGTSSLACHQFLQKKKTAIGGMTQTWNWSNWILWNPDVSTCFLLQYTLVNFNFQFSCEVSPTDSSTFQGSPLRIWTCWEPILWFPSISACSHQAQRPLWPVDQLSDVISDGQCHW